MMKSKNKYEKNIEEDKRPHFINATYPKDELWKTHIYFGSRNGSGSHAHVVASGATILYFRDMEGLEKINNSLPR